ncbi:MAG: hypothetical protein R3F11_10440 [Verrucomicrobiales bacterium]
MEETGVARADRKKSVVPRRDLAPRKIAGVGSDWRGVPIAIQRRLSILEGRVADLDRLGKCQRRGQEGCGGNKRNQGRGMRRTL